MRKHSLRHQERGMALLIALLALLLISAVGLGMIYMSDTETTVNTNYRDTQLAFFAMRGGLEEMRDRMRTVAPVPITPPALMPGNANSIVYLTNPAGGSDTVDPKTYSATNKYFDDEYCHEKFNGTGGYGSNNTCASHPPPSGSVAAYVASISPYTNTTSAMKYKWVRVTLKQNSTFPNNLVAPIDLTHTASSQVCYSTTTNSEVVLSSLGPGTYVNCQDAFANGVMVEPVYVITSFAYTPAGSRRIGQYETAALSITPPGSGLALDGPGSGANFNPSSSNNSSVSGVDGASSPSGTVPPAVPGCSTGTATVPAIGTSDFADQTSIASGITRPNNYPGTAPTYPTGVSATPSVVDMGADTDGTNQLANWSSVGQLNTLTNMIANGADATYTCSLNGVGTACTGSYGSVATPQITYINGDVTLTGGAGILVVTGTLNFNGHMQFDGLILVIGQGIVNVNGGADVQIFGSVFVAQTNSRTSPYAPLASLGAPSFTWNGGGKAGIMYNSCWADIGNGLHYTVVASREEMY
jgi:hypothetical protein